MRIFDVKERLHISANTMPYFFQNEWLYYSSKNVRPFVYDGVVHNSLYRRLNVQLVTTNKCPFNCPFCIEKVNPSAAENRDEKAQLVSLIRIIDVLQKNGMEPTVSITGGEPTLFPVFLGEVKTLLTEAKIAHNLNTALGDPVGFERVNLSVHSQNYVRNARIFGMPRTRYWDSLPQATIQSVIGPEMDSSDKIRSFLYNFPNKRFSMRFPTRTEQCEPFDWKPLFDSLSQDSKFSFVQQKIGDYYFYEEWKFGDKLIHLSYSDLVQLSKYKEKEELEKNFVRAIVILPDGTVKFDWITN